jgi:hypothetical protein
VETPLSLMLNNKWDRILFAATTAAGSGFVLDDEELGLTAEYNQGMFEINHQRTRADPRFQGHS